jgi:ParB-like nuclease domain
MLKRESFPIAKIYVPVKRRATLRPEAVREIAESMLEIGQETPILVRRDGDRFVLVEGLHRLEACKALGEETIVGSLVSGQSNKAPSPYDGDGRTRQKDIPIPARPRAHAPLGEAVSPTGRWGGRNQADDWRCAQRCHGLPLVAQHIVEQAGQTNTCQCELSIYSPQALPVILLTKC